MLAVHWPSQRSRGTYQGDASLPSFEKSKILGTTTFRQCCKSIAQAWRSPSVIGAIMRLKQSRATLCTSSAKEYKFPSVIWLHDGMWITHEVSDDAIRLAEAESLRHVFPGIEKQEPIFKIVSLAPHFTRLRSS